MGFLSSITKPFTNVVKSVTTIVKNPVKAVTSGTLTNTLLTGGVNLAVPKLNTTLSKATQVLTNPKIALPAVIGVASGNPALAISGFLPAPTQPAYGGQPMGINIGGLIGGLGNIFGSAENPYISGVGQIATAFGGAYQQTSANYPAYPITATPVSQPQQNTSVARLGRTSLSAMTQEIITAGGKLLGTLGINVSSAGAFSSILKRSISAIASLARRTPGGTLISMLVGVGLTAYEANLLSAWHAQRKRGRRMNPANAKALRRAARRIKSFHRLCQHTDLIKTRRPAYAGRSRCGTCRKSPCRC